MPKETRQLPIQTNARERFLYADRFFAQEERGNPTTFIKAHEEWLKNLLESVGLQADDRTWSHFHDNAISRSLGSDAPSLRQIQQATYKTVGDVLQALAWFHAPENASWQSPVVTFQAGEEIFTHSGDAEYLFTRNGHYSNSQHWQGWFAQTEGSDQMRELRAVYEMRKQLFSLQFQNPNGFMGWVEVDGKLVYKLEVLNQILADVSKRIAETDQNFVNLADWRAY